MIFKDNYIIKAGRLFYQAFGRYSGKIIALIMLGILSGLLEGIGINTIIPLFSLAMNMGNLGTDRISLLIEKFFRFFHLSFDLKFLLIFIIVLFIFKTIALIISSYINIKIVTDYEEKTRSELLAKTLSAQWPYLLKQRLGHLENTLMNDVQYSALLLQQTSSIIMIASGLAMYIVVAFNISPFITLSTLSLGLIIFLVFKPLTYRIRRASDEVVAINKEISHFINENVLGVKTIKAMFMMDKVYAVGKSYFNRLKKMKIKIFLMQNFSIYVLPPISLIYICLVFAVLYKSPEFNFAALAAVIYLVQKIFQYLQQLQSSIHSASGAIPYLESVLNYQKLAVASEENNEKQARFKFNDCLKFENLTFSYRADKKILGQVNFTIEKGEMVGLIGPSGAGKTTLVDLTLRLFEPNQGKISLDGRDVREISLKDWRNNIGYVSQDIFLINDTITNNIKFYDEKISRERIETAAKMADIYDFIQECPDKFNTMIGDRGILLSAGQRQRLIIARVLARQPKFLVLDEATSALDNESEVKIQKVIENLKGKLTVFVIAHRLSTIINSDKLIVLENGSIVEQGVPAELLKDKESYFYKVYNIRNN